MAVFRVERNKGYTVMSNHHLRNKELSLKAKGLLSQMLSLPEDWDYTLAGLSFINREKIDAIREAVKELERAGYIVRSRERDEKGRLRGADYVIFEQPQTTPVSDLPTLENPTLDNPTLEKPTQEKPTLENPTQLNKDIQKTDLPKKEKLNMDLSSTDSIPIHSLNPLPYDGEAATPPERKRKEATDAYSVYEEIIKDNIEYDHFVRYGQVDKDRFQRQQAEHLKYQHTFGQMLPVIAPMVTLLLVLALTGGLENAFPAGAWNWWYATLLPGTLAVMCYLNIAKEKKNRYYHLNTLAISRKKLMLGKIAHLSKGLFLANFILFAGATIGGELLGTTISISGAVIGMLLLTVSYLWEIPLYLLLSARFGMFADIFLCMVITIGGVATLADTNSWWLCPSSIPIRLMCPTLGLLPNGLSIPAESQLLNTNVILPGILLSLAWFAVMAFLFLIWFEKTEVK